MNRIHPTKHPTGADILAHLRRRPQCTGFNNRQIARELSTASHIVALKLSELAKKGHVERTQKGHSKLPSIWRLL